MSVTKIKTFAFLVGVLVLADQLLGGSSGAVVGLVLGLALMSYHYVVDPLTGQVAPAVPLLRTQPPRDRRAAHLLPVRAR